VEILAWPRGSKGGKGRLIRDFGEKQGGLIVELGNLNEMRFKGRLLERQRRK